jgi:hypothetical protein
VVQLCGGLASPKFNPGKNCLFLSFKKLLVVSSNICLGEGFLKKKQEKKTHSN